MSEEEKTHGAHTPRDPAMETVLGKNPGHLVHRPRHTQTSTWLDYMDNKETRTMPHLPCIHLKCTSMVMDTGNFSIHYSSPVIANICNGSCNIPVSERFTGLKPLPPPTLFSNSGHQAPQSNYEAGTRLQPKRCKHSNVHITLQYLGTGFSVTNEIVNPKDELKMFQQICGGENICVYKGYLSPGETFQFTSKRHYGFPFSASVYINGLIAARISACCEYRYHVGFQQGRRGCFRITQLCGGKPCYR
ncbi:uncharacterized protein LOC142472437 [Ascaphus truei]|uniref:uncharacterized protein LOC142472437 n=1 Tax=Ascaphus truei TaxID=8439 RepID=UPI003F5942E8